MLYTCTALYSLESSRKGFLFPAFSREGSNELYLQDLSLSGRIISFLLIDTREMYSVNKYPPAIRMRVGEMGLLAFLDDRGELEIGIPSILAASINVAQVNDPFSKLEIASLKGDRQMQRQALSACAERFTDDQTSISWMNREKRLFRKELETPEQSSSSFQDDLFSLERDFSLLEENKVDEEWVRRWLRLWGQGFDRRRLTGIAILRQDSGHHFRDSGLEVFWTILNEGFEPSSAERALNVLQSTKLTNSGWARLYTLLFYRYQKHRRDVEKLAFNKLEESLKLRDEDTTQWTVVWSLLMRHLLENDKLLSLAVDFLRAHNYIDLSVARTILTPVVRNPRFSKDVADITVDWLRKNVRSETVWVDLFLAYTEYQESEQALELGLHWCKTLGGNLASWKEVWHIYREKIPAHDYGLIGLDWLQRARKDMRSWVEVYVELSKRRSISKEKVFQNLGQHWLDVGYGTTSTRRKMTFAVEELRRDQ